MSPRNEAKTQGLSLHPTQKHPPVTETPTKHLFITVSKRHSPLFSWVRGPGNLLRDCESSGDRLCLGPHLGCKDLKGESLFRPSLKGGCVGPGVAPVTLTRRSSPPPPAPKSSQWRPSWSSARLLTLAFICLCTDLDNLTLQPYPSSLSSAHPAHPSHHTFFLLPKHAQLIPTSGPLHLLFPLSGCTSVAFPVIGDRATL